MKTMFRVLEQYGTVRASFENRLDAISRARRLAQENEGTEYTVVEDITTFEVMSLLAQDGEVLEQQALNVDDLKSDKADAAVAPEGGGRFG